MKSVAPLSTRLLVFLVITSAMVWANAQLPAQAPAPVALAITDTAALKAHEGRLVTVQGVVSRVGTSKSHLITFINFQGVKPGGFTAVVKSPALPEIERAAGSNLDAALPGRHATLTGNISLYKDIPQIEIKSADQISVRGSPGEAAAKRPR
ncbi:MAG: hypothetical protein K1X78_27045 [Verrucomicrobiaceae bacterium]|nr:hypothetical protein [Verrucomicrobiaceae bacterium]